MAWRRGGFLEVQWTRYSRSLISIPFIPPYPPYNPLHPASRSIMYFTIITPSCLIFGPYPFSSLTSSSHLSVVSTPQPPVVRTVYTSSPTFPSFNSHERTSLTFLTTMVYISSIIICLLGSVDLVWSGACFGGMAVCTACGVDRLGTTGIVLSVAKMAICSYNRR